MHIERSIRKPRQIGLTPLIDVVFLLIIFFMMSTSFIRTESMELSIPKAGEKTIIPPSGIIRIYIEGEQGIKLGEQQVSMRELQTELRLALFKEPERSILLLAGNDVNVQRLVGVMDEIYQTGGKNVSVADWEE